MSDNVVPKTDAPSEAPIASLLSLKIGVMGSAERTTARPIAEKAETLGEAVAASGCVLITGACPGLPLAAARGAKRRGGLVIGISPGLSLDEHAYKYESPTAHHDVLIFTGSGLMGREVVNIRSSDIVVIVGGSSGTLGELAIAYDEGKLIGVLTGTGGITEVVPSVLAACCKETGAKVLYDADPQALVERLLHCYRTEHFRRPSCFCHACENPLSDVRIAGSRRDVVCGMWIDPASAAAKRSFPERRPFYFCSLQCADRFDAEPEQYLSRSDQDVEQ